MSEKPFTACVLLASMPEGRMSSFPGVRVQVLDRRVSDELIAPALKNAWYWPDAKSAIDRHRAHLEVALAAEVGGPVERALALTREVAALASIHDALAVLWMPTSLVHDPEQWIAQADDATQEDLPIFLWIAFEGKESEDGMRSLRSRGAKSFGAMEVEVPESRRDGEDVLETVCDVVLYVLTSPVPLEDGDQIEVTRGKVRVRIESSMQNDGTRAYRLRLP